MLVHTAQAALHCQTQSGPFCWKNGGNAIDTRVFRPAVAAASKQLRPGLLESFRSRSHKSARTSPALPNGTDFQVQSPDVLQYSGAPPDIFQSALTALDLVSPTESYDPDYDEHHEDISLEQGQAAAQVGKAVYEVTSSIMQACPGRPPPSHGVPIPHRSSSCQALARHGGYM